MRVLFSSLLLAGMLCVTAIPVMATTPADLVVLEEDQRMVLPEARMAVTMPAGWEVRTGHGGAIIETAMQATEPEATDACGIQVFRFDGATTRDVAEFLGGSYWDLKRFETSEVQLPSAGGAMRLESPGGERALAGTLVAYIFDAGDRYAWLWCGSSVEAPPDDLWLSIADTIEFLPAED